MIKKASQYCKETLFAHTKGFDIGNDPPAIFNGDCRMQGRLASFGNAVADVFEKYTGRAVLDFGAAQIGRQRGKALTDTAFTIVIVAVALGAEDQVYGFSSVNGGRLRHIDGGLDVGSGRYSVVVPPYHVDT